MQSFIRRLIKPILLRVFPQSFLSEMATEWHFYTVRRRLPELRRQFADKHDLLVNFGTGGAGRDGWVNVDGFPAPGVNCLLDGRGPMPFANESVRGFYSEHFFEHLGYPQEAEAFLRECHRVMKKGAVLRLIVPDAELYLRAYCEPGWNALAAVRPLDDARHDPYGRSYETRMELINEVFRQGVEHKFAYDYDTLEHLLRRCGFEFVTRSRFGESQDAALVLDMPHRQSESLYVEARR